MTLIPLIWLHSFAHAGDKPIPHVGNTFLHRHICLQRSDQFGSAIYLIL